MVPCNTMSPIRRRTATFTGTDRQRRTTDWKPAACSMRQTGPSEMSTCCTGSRPKRRSRFRPVIPKVYLLASIRDETKELRDTVDAPLFGDASMSPYTTRLTITANQYRTAGKRG